MKTQIEKTSNGGWYTIKPEKRLVTFTMKAREIVYTGRAVAAPEDEFDVEKGKRIAKLRAILAMKKDALADLRMDRNICRNVLTNKTASFVDSVLADKIAAYVESIQNLEKKIAEAV